MVVFRDQTGTGVFPWRIDYLDNSGLSYDKFSSGDCLTDPTDTHAWYPKDFALGPPSATLAQFSANYPIAEGAMPERWEALGTGLKGLAVEEVDSTDTIPQPEWLLPSPPDGGPDNHVFHNPLSDDLLAGFVSEYQMFDSCSTIDLTFEFVPILRADFVAQSHDTFLWYCAWPNDTPNPTGFTTFPGWHYRFEPNAILLPDPSSVPDGTYSYGTLKLFFDSGTTDQNSQCYGEITNIPWAKTRVPAGLINPAWFTFWCEGHLTVTPTATGLVNVTASIKSGYDMDSPSTYAHTSANATNQLCMLPACCCDYPGVVHIANRFGIQDVIQGTPNIIGNVDLVVS